jgi:hypothetical protein
MAQESCGGSYCGLLTAQILFLVFTPFIVFFMSMKDLIKYYGFWHLYKPLFHVPDAFEDNGDNIAVFLLLFPLVGTLTLILFIPPCLGFGIVVTLYQAYRILREFTIRFCCCFCQ